MTIDLRTKNTLDPDWKDFFEKRWKEGIWFRPSKALQKLRANPEFFLKQYPIQNMFDCASSGPTQAHIANFTSKEGGRRPGGMLKTKRMHKTQGFRIQNKQFRNNEGFLFQVEGVYIGKSSEKPKWHLLDSNGPDIMFTAKLTGCTFVARPGDRDGQVYVAHLQPHQETGLKLNERMLEKGWKTYGRLNYNYEERTINIIGVRSSDKWQIFTQKLEKSHMTIRSVHRIYPPE